MLFNCNIAESSIWKNVYDALGDQAHLWPPWLSDIAMIERRELAVPLTAGLSTADRTANVLVVQLVHVHCTRLAKQALPRTLQLCNPVHKIGDVLPRNRRSSVSVVMSHLDMDPFQSWPAEESWGVYQLVNFDPDMQTAITQALRNAAESLLQEIVNHKFKSKTTTRKPYERDSQRALEVLKHIQLFRLNCSDKISDMRLGTCPLQLGYADLNQWLQSQDCCGCKTGITGLADVLPERCRCGLLSWKRRRVAQRVVTAIVPEAEWVGVLTHQLKEQALQRFFQGKVYIHACGVLAVDDDKVHTAMVILDTYTETQFCTASIRYHLCFVCPEEIDTSSLEQWLRTKTC